MKLTIQKALLIAISVLFHVAIFAQNAPKNIYELYSITKGGCDFQEIVPSQQLYGQGGGVPSSWPEPNATASENLDSMLLKYREYLNRHPIEPASVRKLKNGNELFPEGNLWGLRGPTGNVLQKPQFQYIEPVNDKLRVFHDGACQYLDGLTGKPLLSQSYLYIKDIGKNEYLVRTKEGYGIVKDGKTVLENKYRRINIERTGNRAYYVIDNSFALLDDLKTKVLPGLGITYLGNEHVMTSENIIDIKGKKKLICEDQQFYFELLNKEPAVFSIKRNAENYLFMINLKGKLLSTQAFTGISHFFEGGLAIASVSKQDAGQVKNMYGLVNLKGEWVLNPEFQWISAQYKYWLAKTPQGQELTFHLDGKPAITEKNHLKKYDSIKPISNDFAIGSAKSGDKTQKDIVKLMTGKAIRENVEYESVSTVNLEKLPCQKQRYIAVSKEGEQVLDENFMPVTPFRKRYFYAGNNFEGADFPPAGKTSTFFDCNGKPLAFDINGKKEDTFKGIKIVNDSIVYAFLGDGRSYWLFGNGKIKVLEKEIGNITPFGIKDLYHVASAYPEHKGVINSEGESIIPMQFKTFTTIAHDTGVSLFETFGGAAGLLDSRGNLVNNQVYDEASWLVFDLYLVKINEKYGVINHRGKEVLPLRYQKIYWRDGVFTARNGTKELRFDITGKLLE